MRSDYRRIYEKNQDEWKALLKELGVEGEWEGIGHCVLGYPDADKPAPPARADGRLIWAEN